MQGPEAHAAHPPARSSRMPDAAETATLRILRRPRPGPRPGPHPGRVHENPAGGGVIARSMAVRWTSLPTWKQQSMLGLGFLLLGVLVTVAERSSASATLIGLGPGTVVGSLVVLVAAAVSWQTERGSAQDAIRQDDSGQDG